MRSDTAFFSAADISRRFLAGLASDLLSAAAAAFVGEEERRDVERAVGADAPRICSTSVNALISAWRRSISLWRLAIACAISLMALESSDPAMGMSTHGGERRVCHGAPATSAPVDYASRTGWGRTVRQPSVTLMRSVAPGGRGTLRRYAGHRSTRPGLSVGRAIRSFLRYSPPPILCGPFRRLLWSLFQKLPRVLEVCVPGQTVHSCIPATYRNPPDLSAWR